MPTYVYNIKIYNKNLQQEHFILQIQNKVSRKQKPGNKGLEIYKKKT